ncbi:UDP-N-acetylmuramate:L-alanyl-gamma-D-glutamyl-meso-diaminopimelate ligase [bacterium]|nr:UDP-N-acetylmuramate:L-alanyl-gamma-D-glutamyl-meso-diaminopimelate ligase [bacterium]
MNPEIKRIYLIGICGTAMASLAGLLKQKGYDVCGSDANVYPPMSTQLEEQGIRLYHGYHAQNLSDANPDLVIPGNAVPRGNAEVEEMLNRRFPYISMAEALRKFFLKDKSSIVIAGTHGKTTTASMAAWLLESSNLNPSFLIGGISNNFGKSFHWNSSGRHFVIEGDEYDTGFMDRRPKLVQYLPEIVILNAVEYDHADLYPDFASVENAFWQFIKVIPGNGKILVSRDSGAAYQLAKRGYSEVLTFGFHPDSDFCIRDEQWNSFVVSFRLNDCRYEMRIFGRHNVVNAAGVAVLGLTLGLSEDQIQQAFHSFQGVRRRMELRGEAGGVAVYDDFAHHPTAIRTTLEGVRLAFPHARIWAIFEPRSWSSRRNVFQDAFSKSFDHADVAVIASIFEPEKVPEGQRLDPHALVDDIQAAGTGARYIEDRQELIAFVSSEAKPGDKLILMSNGSFDGLHDKLLTELDRKDARV